MISGLPETIYIDDGKPNRPWVLLLLIGMMGGILMYKIFMT